MKKNNKALHDFISIGDSAQFLQVEDKTMDSLLNGGRVKGYVLLNNEQGHRLIELAKGKGYSVERLPAPFDTYWQLDPKITQNVALSSFQVFAPERSYIDDDNVTIHRADLLCNVEELAALQSDQLKFTAAATKELESWTGLTGVLMFELIRLGKSNVYGTPDKPNFQQLADYLVDEVPRGINGLSSRTIRDKLSKAFKHIQDYRY